LSPCVSDLGVLIDAELDTEIEHAPAAATAPEKKLAAEKKEPRSGIE